VTSHLFAPGASVLSASLSVVHALASEAEDAGGRSTWYLAFSSIMRRVALSIDISLAGAIPPHLEESALISFSFMPGCMRADCHDSFS
jgi:hypothetical protein